MKKSLVIMISFLAIVVIVVAFVVFYVVLNRSTLIYVDPEIVKGAMGQDFTINISVSGIADLYGWQLKLRWNTTILDVVNVSEGLFLKSTDETLFAYKINSTEGYILADCTLVGERLGVSGNGALAAISFHIKTSGECDLQPYDTKLVNSFEREMPHAVRDGHFSTKL